MVQGADKKFLRVKKLIEELLGQEEMGYDLFSFLYDSMETLGYKLSGKNCHISGNAREILLANYLGHKVSKQQYKEDAMDGETPVEYKSCDIDSSGIKFTFSCLRVQQEEEVNIEYLEKEKVLPKDHYYAVFAGSKVVRCWKLSGEETLALILPKYLEAHKNFKFKDEKQVIFKTMNLTAKQLLAASAQELTVIA